MLRACPDSSLDEGSAYRRNAINRPLARVSDIRTLTETRKLLRISGLRNLKPCFLCTLSDIALKSRIVESIG